MRSGDLVKYRSCVTRRPRVDGDFKCLGVLKPVGVESLESVDVRAFDALNVIGGLMIMSSRLLLCRRRFFFCDASSAFVAETSQLLSAFCDWMSYRWEGKLIGSLADDFLKGDPTFDRSFNLKQVTLTVIASIINLSVILIARRVQWSTKIT